MSASTATSANDRQVGGSHYKTGGLEHWDLFGPEYLMACASKYVARHMDKNGREDLEKAIHYCEKMGEVLQEQKYISSIQVSDMLKWARGTRMTGYEIAICYEIMCMANPVRAAELVRELIEIKYPEQPHVEGKFGHYVAGIEMKRHVDPAELPQNRPGTPEDGGHHALQPVEEENEAVEIQSWDYKDIVMDRLPRSLSGHEWNHRCTEAVQNCYDYDVSAARYTIRPSLVTLTENGRQD